VATVPPGDVSLPPGIFTERMLKLLIGTGSRRTMLDPSGPADRRPAVGAKPAHLHIEPARQR